MPEVTYWNKRYLEGGNSGAGSVGELREWKWSIIDKYVPSLSSIVDIGCGDLSFWEVRGLPYNYLGTDISEEIIHRNKQKYPHSGFMVSGHLNPPKVKSPVVFCFDVLFHITTITEHLLTINNLCEISEDYIFIYTWIKNPLRKWKVIPITHDEYQRFHPIEVVTTLCNNRGFNLVDIHRNKSLDKFGAMLVFKKE